MILLGIGLIVLKAGTVDFVELKALIVSQDLIISPVYLLAAGLFIVGFGLKAAMMPFHAWLPDAHSCAPTPVSATLSGVFIKTLGIYALARIFFNLLGVSSKLLSALVFLGILSMVVGAFLAVVQKDIKRMLAYSSISQVGYIIFAFGLGTPLAIFGGLFHLFNHAVFKSLLFLNAGSIEYSTGRRELNSLGGLNAKLPVTGYSSLLGSLSISGIPPLGGFWSKLLIIVAAVQSGYFGCAAIAVGVSIITLIYYFKFQTFTFFGQLDSTLTQVKSTPRIMNLAMIALGVVCIFSGLLFLPAFKLFIQQAANAVFLGIGYRDLVFGAIR
jgi:multicomponent Na+:H+ antiporter subunit D